LGNFISNPVDLSTVATKPEPNLQSIVVLLSAGQHSFLLGADMEVVEDDNLGWNGVIKSKALIGSKKSIYFKIPHHGSENGYNEDIWKKLVLEEEAILTTSSIITGKIVLPTSPMIKTVCDFSNNFYITSNPKETKKAKHQGRIQKFIDSQGIKITKIPFEFGQIRYRLDIKDSSAKPTTELFGAGIKVDCANNS